MENETRKNEHIRNVKQNTAGSNIAKHSWANDHTINFEDGQVIYYRVIIAQEKHQSRGTQQLQWNRTIMQNHYRNSIAYYEIRLNSVNLCLYIILLGVL